MTYLIVGTILLAVVVLILIIKNTHDRVRVITPAICLVALSFSLISSYGILFQPFEPEQFRFLSLINPQLIFLFNVLLKFLIFYWLVAIATGIIDPERISKYGAKLLGLEVYSEYAKIAREIEDNADRADRQMDLIVELNRNIFDLLLKPFEESIVKAEKKADLIRSLVKDILIKSYANHPAAKIYVIPLDESGFQALGEELTAYVRPLVLENRALTIIERQTVGIGLIPGLEDLGTAIVIDTSAENYQISDAEICSVGSLFVSIATAVHWALRAKEY